MPTLHIKGQRIKPNAVRFTKRLHERVSNIWTRAAREFVRAAAIEIKVDTGMSLASLMPLARVVRATEAIAGAYTGTTRKGYYDMSGKYHSSPNRSVSLGVKFGRNAYKILFGSPVRPIFVFDFDIQVFQYLLHEFGYAKYGSGPWNSLERGREAFLDYFFSNVADAVPRPNEWLDLETF